jgi:hypothetical protein
MAQGYELMAQASPGGLFDVDRAEAALLSRGANRRPDGALNWPLPMALVEVYRVLEAGQPVALTFKVPLTAAPELLQEVLYQGKEVAVAGGGVLVDPNLGRAVSLADESAVADSYLRTLRYAGEYLGVGEAVSAMPVSHYAVDQNPSTLRRTLVLGILFFVALYLAYSFVSQALVGGLDAAPPGDGTLKTFNPGE